MTKEERRKILYREIREAACSNSCYTRENFCKAERQWFSIDFINEKLDVEELERELNDYFESIYDSESEEY